MEPATTAAARQLRGRGGHTACIDCDRMKLGYLLALGALGTVTSCAAAQPLSTSNREHDVQGLRTRASHFAPKETMDRLEAGVRKRGMSVFLRLDHAAGAAAAGLTLRPTELLVFGAAKGGTPLMQAQQTLGIDLPLKALVWEDADGHTWLSYDEPRWLAARHGSVGPDAALGTMDAMLEAVSKEAAEAP